VILVDSGGRVLLQQRDDDIPPAGYGRWSIPGGRREGDESPRETALREFEEETGVRLARLRFVDVLAGERTPPGVPPRLHVFFADDEVTEDAIDVREGLAFRYFSPEETASLPMNPATRAILQRFFADDKYRGLAATKAPFQRGVALLVLDQWGRVLLQLRDDDLPPERLPGVWSLPGGLVEAGESPDAAAIREFEEETGQVLEELRLFHVFRRATDLPEDLVDIDHVYYADPAIPEEAIEVREGQAFRYFAPGEVRGIPVPPHARTILERFFASTAYRALFH
jgi:8-oxo-dGTP pyrophosphatase MutT (NUDIX family)